MLPFDLENAIDVGSYKKLLKVPPFRLYVSDKAGDERLRSLL